MKDQTSTNSPLMQEVTLKNTVWEEESGKTVNQSTEVELHSSWGVRGISLSGLAGGPILRGGTGTLNKQDS